MIKSACQMLMYRSYQASWKRGENYAKHGKVKITKFSEASVQGQAFGTSTYDVELKFKSGGISRSCTCPVNDFCKHITALAILWDEAREISRPSQEEVENETIPPPLVTSYEIKQAYDYPLTANLDTIRLAASGRGGWSRPHAHLPRIPKAITNEAITPRIVKKSLTEIRSWSRRHNYDFYFCAGEMMAAFCEVIRHIIKEIECLNKDELHEILAILCDFDNELVFELIDDSDGLHIFSEVHIHKLQELIK